MREERTIDRRELLRYAAAGAGLAALPGTLAGCGAIGSKLSEQTGPVRRRLKNTMVISTWPFYIDIDAKTKRRPTLEAFENQTGVNVRYIEDINSNDEFFAKVRPPLSRGESIGRDIIVPTDYMAARMRKLGWLRPLDLPSIPNHKNLDPLLADPAWDPPATLTRTSCARSRAARASALAPSTTNTRGPGTTASAAAGRCSKSSSTSTDLYAAYRPARASKRRRRPT